MKIRSFFSTRTKTKVCRQGKLKRNMHSLMSVISMHLLMLSMVTENSYFEGDKLYFDKISKIPFIE